jgi:hypothetical protein
MKNNATPWGRLVTLARLAPADSRDASAPVGFATRVVALAFAAQAPSFATLFARVAPRALGACGLLMALVATLNVGAVLNAVEINAFIDSDPVTEWVDVGA